MEEKKLGVVFDEKKEDGPLMVIFILFNPKLDWGRAILSSLLKTEANIKFYSHRHVHRHVHVTNLDAITSLVSLI